MGSPPQDRDAADGPDTTPTSRKRRKLNPATYGLGLSSSTQKSLQSLRHAFTGALGLGLQDRRPLESAVNKDDDGPGQCEPNGDDAGDTAILEEEQQLGSEKTSRRQIKQKVAMATAEDDSTSSLRQAARNQTQLSRDDPGQGSHGSATAVTPTKRKVGRPRKKILPTHDARSNPNTEDVLEQTQDTEQPTPGSSGRSGGRTRQKPRRYSDDMVVDGPAGLVGILTPSKKKRGRSKKAVTFGDQGHEAPHGLGFKDIPSPVINGTTVTDQGGPKRDFGEDDYIGEGSRHISVHDPMDEVVEEEAASDPSSDDDKLITPQRKRSRLQEKLHSAQSIESREAEDTIELVNNQTDEASPSIALSNGTTTAASVLQNIIEDHPDAEKLLGCMQRVILEKCTGRCRIGLVGLEEQYRKVHQLAEQTVVAGEGNSMLVLGARGSGKTTLVETVLSDLSRDHGSDFHVVRLNGFIHTDDKLALRDIWSQLGREMEGDDEDVGKSSNYADTLSSLLALLSHPSELSETEPDQAATAVIFVLDEFDLFASHPRQTLLYNLFDIAQARKAPVAVLGLTTRIDVVESLEKRVKSRFSHRSVHLSLSKTLGGFWEACKQGVRVTEGEMEEQGQSLGKTGGLTTAWDGYLEELYTTDAAFREIIQSIYYRTKSVKDFLTTCLIPFSSMTPEQWMLTGHDFADNHLIAPDSKLQILEGLSEAELGLMIAAARLDIILDTDTCNFNMAYDEYGIIASRSRLQSSASGVAAVGASSKIWGKEVGLAAWETLAEYELIVPAVGAAGTATGVSGAGGGAGSRDVGRAGRMFRVDVALEEILPSVPGMSAVMAKWCREI
ncbi:MAG: hypothetical protein M1817_006289 [Caeruleum heppii]|nr:MAG: hypothetical protein M1817_006289 [Caeruleum heppii]